METKMKSKGLAERYRITRGAGFRFAKHDPADDGELDLSKKQASDLLTKGVERLAELQDTLYAQDRWSVLLIFQAMDAAGKDSAIKHVMSGVNPQGCDVHAFKTPSVEELDHDWMWRTTCRLPERGRIGIFNRSYYEEMIVVRIHGEYLRTQKIPPKLVTKDIWKERYEDTRAFESYLARNGTIVLKFFLNVSKAEQKKRFLQRLDEPEKNWKFNVGDVAERARWDDYMRAYEDVIRATAAPHAPWFVVPADKKWFTRIVVAEAIIRALEELDLAYPTIAPDKLKEFETARTALLAD